MNLIQIREKFRDLSGHYELVNEDLSDNGADFYINEASKWLDRTVETTKSWGTYLAIIPIGTWNLRFPFARAIKEVWIATVNGRWQLDKKRLQDIIAAYFTKPPAEWINGTPLYYSPTISRYIPEPVSPATLATYTSYIGVITNTNLEYNSILLSTPVALETSVEVHGLFYSHLLQDDDDENYWSLNHPMMLIQAAIRQTYVASGNAPMLKIIQGNITDDLTRLGMDLVEQEIAEIDEMDG